MSKDDGFVLIEDDDGHWFVCPADKQTEAAKYFERLNEFYANYLDVPEGTREPALPVYLVPVGGAPSLVRFTGYRID